MSGTVAPDRILHQLAALWTEEGKQGESGVLRACSMTLVVLAEEGEDTGLLGETIAALMPQHPARAILVRLHGAGERALSERVYQQCWRPFGQRQQICCEQIEITASDAALGDLPSVILPLVVADLPVILWCRSPRLIGMPEFEQIARMATKVVVNSGAMADAKEALQRMENVHNRHLRIGDLAWTRLTRWREMLARVFENREYLARLNAISAVEIAFGAGYETAAWYLAAWAKNALEDAGVHCTTAVTPGAQTLSIQLAGEKFHVSLEREGETLLVTVDDLTNRTNLPLATDYLLMREELGIVRGDPVFDRSLSTAARLAVSSSS